MKPPRIFSEFQIVGAPSVSFGFGENFQYPEVTMEPKTGYFAGVGAKNSFSRHISFWSTFLFEKKGWKSNATTRQRPQDFQEVNSTHTFLTFSFRPTVSIGKQNKLSVGFGGYFSRLINRKDEIVSYVNGVLTESYSVTGLTNNRPYDAGLNLDLGYRLTSTERFETHFHLGNFYGLVDITDPKQPFLSIFLNTVYLKISFNIKRT
jgi:hypothetical protein